MTAVHEQIDGLYRLPLDEFTAARNALAKSLGGDQAKEVRALVKQFDQMRVMMRAMANGKMPNPLQQTISRRSFKTVVSLPTR